MPVREWMKRAPITTVRADATVAAAAALMRGGAIRHLPVVDAAGRLVGIVTDRDLRQALFDPAIQERLGERADALRDLMVREVMTWDVLSVRPDTDVREATRLMRERKIGALVVVEAGVVVGILSELDLLAAFETLLRQRLVQVRPLDAAAGGAAWEFGFPLPAEADVEEGVVD